MADDFWFRLRKLFSPQRYRQPSDQPQSQPRQQPHIPSQQPVQPQPVQQNHGPLTTAEKTGLIHQAGRELKRLEIKYDGVDRLVEPYSFRSGKTGLLFFGWCSIHDKIHSFKLEKIEEIKVSEFPFSPRFEVEL